MAIPARHPRPSTTGSGCVCPTWEGTGRILQRPVPWARVDASRKFVERIGPSTRYAAAAT